MSLNVIFPYISRSDSLGFNWGWPADFVLRAISLPASAPRPGPPRCPGPPHYHGCPPPRCPAASLPRLPAAIHQPPFFTSAARPACLSCRRRDHACPVIPQPRRLRCPGLPRCPAVRRDTPAPILHLRCPASAARYLATAACSATTAACRRAIRPTTASAAQSIPYYNNPPEPSPWPPADIPHSCRRTAGTHYAPDFPYRPGLQRPPRRLRCLPPRYPGCPGRPRYLTPGSAPAKRRLCKTSR